MTNTVTPEINIVILDVISGKISLPSLDKMTAEYEAEKAEFSTCNDVASRVRSQGRYVNRLAELTGAIKNGDQCGEFQRAFKFWFLTFVFRDSSKEDAIEKR